MCEVVCVKVCVGREADEHSFAVRMHKPLAFEKVFPYAETDGCSCWVLLQGVYPVVQDLFSNGRR